MKRLLLIATVCLLALVVASDAESAGKGGNRGGSRGSVSRGSANRGSTANRGGNRGGAAKSGANRGGAAKRTAGKGNAAKGGAARTNAAKQGAGKTGKGGAGSAARGSKGGQAKGGKGNAVKGGRAMPRGVQGRALPRNHTFGRSLFNARLGITLWANGDGPWYYWYAPFDSYLPIDFLDTYSPDDSAAVTVTPDDAV